MSGLQGDAVFAPRRRARRAERQPITDKVVYDWKVQCLQALGWESKTQEQTAMFDEISDVAGRTLQGGMRGSGANSAIATEPLLKGAGNHFKVYHDLRKAFEKADPRTGELVTQLRRAAQDYVDHFEKDYSKREKSDGKNIAKKEACQATINELRRFDVALKIADLPAPPWDSEMAQQAAALKIEMDIASLPPGQQRASTLGGDHLSPAFWIEKRGSSGRKDKTYIFKPSAASEQPGYPHGGEPLREAMSSRVADMLNGALGLNLPVPETQVVSVGKESLPPDALTELVKAGKIVDQPVYTGSVQQVAAGVEGDMRSLSAAQMASIDTRSVHELAVLDIITLNTDRHAGNMLVKPGAQPNDPPGLVPIDNGLAFPSKRANVQMTTNIGSTHNVLMAVPGSHEPFTPEMLQALAKLDPNMLADALKREQEAMVKANNAMQDKLSNESVDMSRRSAMFLKRAAPTLSPAAIQTALSQHNAEIFDLSLDDNAFNTVADRIIAEMAQQLGPLKEYFLMPTEMQRKMKSDLADLGWDTGKFLSGNSILTNPAMAMKVWKSGIRCPKTDRDPNRRPLDLYGTEQEKQEIAAARTAFPQTKEPKTDDEERALLEDWREWQALRGTQSLLMEAITQTGVRGGNISETQQNLSLALSCFKRARALGEAIAADTTDPDLFVITTTAAFLRSLTPILAPPAQTVLNRVVEPITVRLQQQPPMTPQETQAALQQLGRVRDPMVDAARKRLVDKFDLLIATSTDDQAVARAKEVRPEAEAGALTFGYEELKKLDPVLADAP